MTAGPSPSDSNAKLPESIQQDVASIARIDAVQSMLEVVCRTTGMGFSAVTRVTETHWVACAVRDEIAFGLLPGGELELQSTLCHEVRRDDKFIAIEKVSDDPLYRTHHTPLKYGFESYISLPIYLKDGAFFGTLCAIDPRPAPVMSPEILGMFRLFADLIAFHLDAQKRLEASQAALSAEQHKADLREQFVAVLGHDLRNPLAALGSGLNLLEKANATEMSRSIIGMMRKSTFRMGELIENVLDLSRARLGGGFTLNRRKDNELVAALQQVIDEMRLLWPDRAITVDCAVNKPVDCDRQRVAQILSNLLANAITHGSDGPVRVAMTTDQSDFRLTVENQASPLPRETMLKLFQPFFRSPDKQANQGLGLGLFIADELARAHGGTLKVEQGSGKIAFILEMKL